MKISASIYSSKQDSFEELIHELDACRVNYFHIDCNDNPEVFNDIEKIRQLSKTPVDLHLITSDPEKYFPYIKELKIENVTFQYENLLRPLHIPPGIRANIGLALISETPLHVFDNYASRCGFILFMTTTPGMSGGVFQRDNFRKIRQFRNTYPDKKIHVDGGINDELSFILRNMGVYTAVIGSYLFSNGFIGSAMLQLKSDNIDSRYRICDFMLEQDEIPLIGINDLSFANILHQIDYFKMGFVNVTDENGVLIGIISNADIRKGLIKNINDMNRIDPMSLINRNPASVYEDDTISELLAYIKNLSFPVLFLPVVNQDRQLTGTIKFNNLIKGES